MRAALLGFMSGLVCVIFCMWFCCLSYFLQCFKKNPKKKPDLLLHFHCWQLMFTARLMRPRSGQIFFTLSPWNQFFPLRPGTTRINKNSGFSATGRLMRPRSGQFFFTLSPWNWFFPLRPGTTRTNWKLMFFCYLQKGLRLVKQNSLSTPSAILQCHHHCAPCRQQSDAPHCVLQLCFLAPLQL